MSIVVECPHCETRYNLQPDLLGKSMRCPNLDCREVFVVRETGLPAPAPIAPAPLQKPAAPRVTSLPEPVRAPRIIDAEVVEPAAREVVWSEGTAPPPSPRVPRRTKSSLRKSAPPPEPVAVVEDEEPPSPRRKARRRPVWLVSALGLVTLALIGVGVVYLIRFQIITESQLASRADEEYRGGQYGAAAKTYEKLAADYPDSSDAAKYQFFAELAAVQVVVRSVTVREDPEPALRRLREFIESRKESPLAQPETGYGHDILDAGKKVGEDIVANANDRVKAFRNDRSKGDELDRADNMVTAGRSFLTLLEPFRDAEARPFDGLRRDFDRAEIEVKRERQRLALLGRVRSTLGAPSDRVIEEARAVLAAEGLADDAEGRELLRTAVGRLGQFVRIIADPAAPLEPPKSTAASLFFVTPAGPPRAMIGAADATGGVFLAVSRGVLYALDETTGDFLWAARVGTDVTDPPALASIESADGRPDLAVAASNVAGKPGLTGYSLRTGQARWFQSLPAPAAGAAVVVGNRALIPLRDPDGTILEFDILTGDRVTRITVGQPLAPAVHRSGTGLVYVPADARRVYVLEIGAKDEDGNRLPPRCAQVLATGHPPSTLRTRPTVIGPDGDAAVDHWLLLAQADGPTAMKLRAFPLPPVPPRISDNPPPAEIILTPDAEVALSGWAWFPPASDGERLAVATDSGSCRVFGVNQPGNTDPAFFPLPSPSLPKLPDEIPIPGLVVPAGEMRYLVLAGGQARRFHLTLVPSRGLEMIEDGEAFSIGVPTQPFQMSQSRELACIVVRSPNSSGVRGMAIDLRSGETRWSRHLGVIPITAPFPGATGTMVVDEDGGILTLPPPTLTTQPGTVRAIGRESVAVMPPESVASPTMMALSNDGRAVYTVTPVLVKAAPHFVIRHLIGGRLHRAVTLPAPCPLAGTPVVLGEALLLPGSDGFVYRYAPSPGKPDVLVPGPRWSEARRDVDAVCYLTAIDAGSFLASDGGRKLTRWSWPVDGGWTPGGVIWEVRERIAVPPLLLPANGAGGAIRLLVADVTGSVWLYPVDRTNSLPLRRWRPGGTNPVPVGKPSTRLMLQKDPMGRQLVAYVVDGRHIVGLDPDRNDPLWLHSAVADSGGVIVGPPQAMTEGGWTITDLAGRVKSLDGRTGTLLRHGVVGTSGAITAVAGLPIEGDRVLCLLSDGSAVVVALLENAPGPRGKE